MRYVRHFNIDWYRDLITDFERCYQELWYKLEGYNNFNNRTNRFKSTPIQGKNGITHPFPFAEKVYEVYEWLIGESKHPPKHIDDTLDFILQLAYFNPFIDFTELAHEIEWERWNGMHTGSFYSAAVIALKLNNGKDINATEMSLMLHISQVAVVKQIQNNKFPAKKIGSAWKIDARVAAQWIAEYNTENPIYISTISVDNERSKSEGLGTGIS
jgi:hypothetical protein